MVHQDISLHNTDSIELTEIDRIVAGIGTKPHNVIAILQAIQNKYHYLPQEALRRVCDITEITPAAITGVATFYSQFRFRPAGRHSVKVCIGTACHIMGGESIFDAIKQYLAIPESDDTDSDRLFTVEKVACLGCCMLAPAVQIDNVTYGFLAPARVPDIIQDFLTAQNNGAIDRTNVSDRLHDRHGEINLCLCSSCIASGSEKIYQEFLRQIHTLEVPAIVKVVGCTGMAYQTPLVEIRLQDGRRFRYGKVKLQNVREILLNHFRPVTLKRRTRLAITRLLERLLTNGVDEPVIRYAIDTRNGPDATFCNHQQQIVTEHSGYLEPLNLDEYRSSGGFTALERCVSGLTPEEIIEQVKRSELRGRGGAGYPTGKKWQAVKAAAGAAKYIICNGDEGDPGAFMDRMILESFPFRVIEGMVIASYALAVSEGFLYIRAEYPIAIRRVQEAIKICQSRGYLGDNILASGHNFHLNVVAGAGAFVCGEETALMAAIQGQRGMPSLRPPYPAEKGLWGKPTLVNNVETFASIPWIIREGAEKFASLGTIKSRGSKTFALAGKVVRSGLIEVPMGMSLRQIVEQIGGGVPNGKKLKAIQVGGPSGGCVPAWLADTPVDYEALVSAGAIMGSGGLVVLDESDCMVEIARYFMAFTRKESCGRCTFCRIGTRYMLEILDRLCQGSGQEGDIEKLELLAEAVTAGSLCGLGKTAPNPVLSTIKHFRDEYQAHIDGRCPAGKCKALITYAITEDCIGCTRCAQNCSAGAIVMKPYERHVIDPEKCSRCDTCRQVCPVAAVKVA